MRAHARAPHRARSVLPRVDAVLLTHPDVAHLGALPVLVGRHGLAARVYSTTPVRRMGHLAMQQLLVDKRVGGSGRFLHRTTGLALPTGLLWHAAVRMAVTRHAAAHPARTACTCAAPRLPPHPLVPRCCRRQGCSDFSAFSAEDVAAAFDPVHWTTLRFYQKFTLEIPGGWRMGG